jgi:hypothetical protein
MGNLLSIKKKSCTLSRQELIEIGKTARQERDRLLNEYPHLREFQENIDRCLDNAGSSENRMAVLGIMMEAKLKELRDELSQLSTLMRQYKTPSHTSDK